MKLSAYLKDRIPAYVIFALTWVLIVIFLFTFHVKFEAVCIISGIFWLGAWFTEIWGYLRKHSFYCTLMHNLEQLDRKYLISEMTDEPEFYEGKLLCEVLRDSNKSMCEHIGEHRRENAEFRDYIELWVHEVKLPVAGLQLMCHNDGNAKYAEQLKRIDDYIENVLYYARSRNAEKDYIIKPVMLKRIFADTAIKNREELQMRDIALSAEGLDKEVMTDAKWLMFILGQLMNNSMKYNASEITVTAEDTTDATILHFRDNGIGIPEKDLPYIFEKSFTGENGRTHSKSTGMGLYIVSQLCKKLGHSVSASSVQGEYTEISIKFGKNDLYRIQ